MLSDKTIELVKSTLPLLENAGTAITEHFYRRLFSHHPELQNVFNMSHQASGRQQFALFSAIAAFAKHIEQPEVLQEMSERIAHKHASLLVQPEHYPIVGEHLLATLRELAPDAFTPEIEQAWAQAYGLMADLFIGREAQLYDGAEQQAGGWRGSRRFYVDQKTPESDLVTSFVLKPVDGEPVAPFHPGQYLGIQIDHESLDYREIRQYSLSDSANGESYRISVKREGADRPGLVSHFLHDQLEQGDEIDVMPPGGDFFLRQQGSPVYLISAGVGITPMISMLETLVKEGNTHTVTFLHACENEAQHSFLDRLSTLEHVKPWLTTHTWYRQPSRGLTANQYKGLMQIGEVEELVAGSHYYLCGPVPFMALVKRQLMDKGVEAEYIHYEVFGPHKDLD